MRIRALLTITIATVALSALSACSTTNTVLTTRWQDDPVFARYAGQPLKLQASPEMEIALAPPPVEILYDPTSPDLRTDEAMIAHIKRHEGLRLKAYIGLGGNWLIGYGHLPTAHEGMVISNEKAEELFWDDIARTEQGVRELLTRPIRKCEFSAMVDLAYNVGVAKFAQSSVLRAFNLGDRQAAADALLLWNKVYIEGEMREIDHIARRRAEAREHFLGETEFAAIPQIGPGLRTQIHVAFLQQ